MQKSNNEIVESVLMAIPADLLEEVGIDLYSTIQIPPSSASAVFLPRAGIGKENRTTAISTFPRRNRRWFPRSAPDSTGLWLF